MEQTQTDEAELWRRGLGGDAGAFGAIFDRHKDRVFRHAYRLLADRHDAEDATATAFLELWRRRTAVRVVDGSLLPWLLVTVGHAASNLSRSTARYRRLLDRLPRGEHTPAGDAAVDERLAPFGEELHEGWRRLGAVDRDLAALVILEGYPVREAAEALGLTPGAAKTRLSRVKARLRAQLVPSSGPAGTLIHSVHSEDAAAPIRSEEGDLS